MKSCDDKSAYNPNEVIRNPQCLNWEGKLQSTAAQPVLQVNRVWTLPSSHSLKWIIDASLNMAISKSVIGGVLRDDSGNFKCLFSSLNPFVEINHAEVLIIHWTLNISLASYLLNVTDLNIESNSSNAGTWNLSFHINVIRRILKSRARISLIYKERESDIVADTLAKQGLRRLDDFVAWL